MTTKLDTESICNKYCTLFSSIKSLEKHIHSTDIADHVIKTVTSLKTDLCNLKDKKSSYSPLTDEIKKLYTILPAEEEEIAKLGESLGADSNTLRHFLACAKVPHYLTKVPKNMRRSFVDTAIALYFTERYYLFASISKLIELKNELEASSGARDPLYETITHCNTILQSECLPLLVNILQTNINTINKCSPSFLSFLGDETTLIIRSLLFHRSFSPVTSAEFIAICELKSTLSSLIKKIHKERKGESVRLSLLRAITAHLDFLHIAMVMGVGVDSSSRNLPANQIEGVLADIHQKQLTKKNAVAVWAVSVRGLSQPVPPRRCQENVIGALQRGVFSILSQDIALLQTHLEDPVYFRTLLLLLFNTLQKYLFHQSSQWHTLTSKQFEYYNRGHMQSSLDSLQKDTTEKDGLETLIYLLQHLLQKLPDIVVSLSGSSVEACPLAYFCSMLSDRLRAEPYLFDAYLNLLTAIANTSAQSAEAVYRFIDKAPSEHVNWNLMLHSLNEGDRLLQTDVAQRGLLDADVTGFIAILGLLTAVLRHGAPCPAIRSNVQVNTVSLCIHLLHQPVHIVLKARLCALLACLASEDSFARVILQQLEYGQMLTADPNTGLRYELEMVETTVQAYPLTSSFLSLLLALLRTLSPRVVLASSAFPVLLQYVLHGVFLPNDRRTFLFSRTGEKPLLSSLCLQFLTPFLALFHELATTTLPDEDRMLQQRLSSLVSELLSNHEVFQQMMTMMTVTPSHTLLDRLLPTDTIAESSMLVDLHLLDSYSFQLQLVRDSAGFLLHLLRVTPELIARLALRSQTSRTSSSSSSSLVPTLASQLLADGTATMSLLLHVTTVGDPALQLVALRILRLLADQLSAELFTSLFLTSPEEASSICTACNDLLTAVLFTNQRDQSLELATPEDLPEKATPHALQAEACRVLLDMLVAHASTSFPSPTSVLLSLPRSLVAVRASPARACLLNTLVTFLECPGLVSVHAVLASKITRLFFLLCSHRDREILPELCSVLLERQVFSRLLSALPYLQRIAFTSNSSISSSSSKETNSINHSLSSRLTMEEVLGLLNVTAHVLQTLALLLHLQKRMGSSLEGLCNQLQAMLEYSGEMVTCFESGAIPETSPLLDTLKEVDQRFAEPANMPPYLNDCTKDCWIQRQLGDTTFQQVDLHRLAKNIVEVAQANGIAPEQAHYFAMEGTAWSRQWNLFMEIEAVKSLAFTSGCRLLHLYLIENYEAVPLLPRFASAPTDLHVAVLQALLSLVPTTNTFDRPYLASLGDLFLDLFALLHKQTSLQMKPFTQQAILNGLLQTVLSPVVQQRQEERSCRLRGQLYLPLLSFLLLSFQQHTTNLLLSPLQTALPLLIPSLAQDSLLLDLQGRAASLALLHFLLQSPIGGEALRLLLLDQSVLQDWLQLLRFVEPSLIDPTPIAAQQREVVLRILHVLQTIAGDTTGATVLLQSSVFLSLSQSPLLLLGSPPGYPPAPSKFTTLQKTALRQIVRRMLLLILTLVNTVRSFRGVREEIIGFVRSSLNLSLILLEDCNEEDLLSLETFALYESVLALLACKREELAKELQGYEEVVAKKMRDELARLSEMKSVMKAIRDYRKSNGNGNGNEKDKKIALYCRIVESSILFLHEYGETISRELLQTFGFN